MKKRTRPGCHRRNRRVPRADRRRGLFETLECRRVLATTVFSDTFESGPPINTANWPSTGFADYYPWVRREGVNGGPIGTSGTYAAAIFGLPFGHPDRGFDRYQDVGFQTKNLNLSGYVSANLSYRIQAKGNGDLPESPVNDLQVQYRASNGSWKAFKTESSLQVSDDTFDIRNWPLPTDAIHSTAAIRFYALGLETEDITGWPAEKDHWFLDVITVSGNRRPTVTIGGGGSGKDNVEHALTWAASDPDGDAVTVTKVELLKGGSLLRTMASPYPDSGTYKVLTSDGPGVYSLRVTVSDGSVSSGAVTGGTYTVTDDDVAKPVITINGSSGSELSSLDQRFQWSVIDASDSTSTARITKDGVEIFSQSYTSNVSLDTYDFNARGVGRYLLDIRAFDKDMDGGRLADVSDNYVTREVNVKSSPPIAQLSITTPIVQRMEGSAIAFSSAGSSDPDGGALSYVWNFGDGTLGLGATPSHTYADNGTYTVSLRADSSSSDSVTETFISVGNVAPVIIATGEDSVDETSSYQLLLSHLDPGNDTAVFSVDWGDGLIETLLSDGLQQHAYASGDQQHTIRVSAHDEDGVYLDQFVQVVEVTNAPPRITNLQDFWTGEAGTSLTFAVSVLDGADDILNYSWDFGDGTVLSGTDLSQVSHAYAQENVYSLKLIISDSDGLDTVQSWPVVIGSPVSFSLSALSVSEDVDTVAVVATLQHGIPLDHSVTIPVVVGGDVATLDYDLPVTAIEIPAGQLTGFVNLRIRNDTLDEDDERLVVRMGQTVGASHGLVPVQTIQIVDNDTKPLAFFVSDNRTISEDSSVITWTAALSAPSGRDVVVPLMFAGTALVGADYQLIGLPQITIPAGALSGGYSLRILDDRDIEPAESIIASLTPSDQAEPSSAAGQPTVTSVIIPANDAPVISFTSVFRVTDEGEPTINIRAFLSQFSDTAISVSATVSGTAQNGPDYQIASTTFTFPPGTSEASLTLTITDDLLAEDFENILIELQDAPNVLMGSSQSFLAGVLDNDLARVSFVTGDVAQFEGKTIPITVQLSTISETETRVPLIKTGTAREGADFTISTWEIVVPAGASQATAVLTLLDDTAYELEETIYLALGDIVGGVPGARTSKAISVKDTDPLISLSTQEITFTEADGSLQLVVQLSAPTDRDVTVSLNYSGTAAQGGDFSGPASIVINAGDISKTVTLTLIDDAAVEPSESVGVKLRTPTSGILAAAASVSLTILDNDAAPSVYWTNRDNRTFEGSTTFAAGVALTTASLSDVTIVITDVAGGAQPFSDYQIPSTTVTIPAGATFAAIPVSLVDDALGEGTEGFSLTFVSASNANLPVERALWQATVTIASSDHTEGAKLKTIGDALPSWFVGLDIVADQYQQFKANYQGRAVDSIIAVADFAAEYIPPPFNLVVQFSAWTLEWLREEYPLDGWINGGAVARDADTVEFWVSWAVEMGENIVTLDVGLPWEVDLDAIGDGLEMLGEKIADLFPLAHDLGDDDVGEFLAKAFGGYGQGATVFFDMDLNGIRSSSEPAGQSTADGFARIPNLIAADVNHDGLLGIDEGQWVAVGGVDTSVNEPLRLMFKAPANYRMITPSSTMISALLDTGAFARTTEGVTLASTRFLTALGLQERELWNLDFVSAAARGDHEAAALFGKETQLYDTIISIASIFDNPSNGLPFSALTDAVIEDIASKISAPDSSLDLARREVVTNIVQGVASRIGAPLSVESTQALCEAIAETNLLIDELIPHGSQDYLNMVVKVQGVAQGSFADSVKRFAQGALSLDAFQLEASNLRATVEAEQAYNVLPVYLGISSARMLEGATGEHLLEFTVVPYGMPALPITVAYTTGDNTALAGQDYTATTGVLTWMPGETAAKTITVSVSGDVTHESDETFDVFLSIPVNAALLSSLARGTILNDDAFSHSTLNHESNALELSIDGSNLFFSVDGDSLLAARYVNGATLEIAGDSSDSLSIFDNNFVDVIRIFDSADSQRLILDGHRMSIQGNVQLDESFLTRVIGLPNVVVANHELTLSAFVPTSLDETSLLYNWKVFLDGGETPLLESTTEAFTFSPEVGSFRLELSLFDGLRTSSFVGHLTATIPNLAPNAVDDSANTTESAVVTVDVIANDTDANAHDSLSIAEGTLAIQLAYVVNDGRIVAIQTATVSKSPNNITFNPGDDFAFLAGGETATVIIPYHVTDDASSPLSSSGVLEIIVVGQNNGPSITVNTSAVSVVEGGIATNSGQFVDLDLSDSVELLASQGSVTKSGTSSGAWSWSYSAVDDSVAHTVTITATDSAGASISKTFSLSVLNANPVFGSNPTLSDSDEGSSVAISLPFSDAGKFDLHTAMINWGDGSPAEAGLVSELNGLGVVAGSHAYADNGRYTVMVTVKDDNGGSDTETFTMTVGNAAPVLSVIANYTIGEGALLSLENLGTFTDPGFDNPLNPSGASVETFSFSINWGDGTSADMGGATRDISGNRNQLTAGSFDGSHIFADDGTYIVTVRVSDDDGDFDERTFEVKVNNVNPTIDLHGSSFNIDGAGVPVPFSGVRGQTLEFNGGFTDPGFDNSQQGLVETFSYVIQWGDGTANSTGTATIDSNGGRGVLTEGSLFESHIFTAVGSYTVTLMVTDDDGATTTISKLVTISDVAMQVGGNLAVGGTTLADKIHFKPSNDAALEVSLNGVLKGTYSPIGRLAVFAQAGDDDVQVAGSLKTTAWIYGGDGADRIKGGDGDDSLFGGLGEDLIDGGGGRDLIIGGEGADRLVGNSNDDILIAGSTSFDPDSSVNVSALLAIMQEWTSARTYSQRVANLSDRTTSGADGSTYASRSNGGFFLRSEGTGATVLDDNALDVLTGAAGQDWFLFNGDGENGTTKDKATDLHASEFAADINWLDDGI